MKFLPALLLITLPTLCFAGINEDASLAFHIAPTAKNLCVSNAPASNDAIVTEADPCTIAYYVYAVICDANELSGIEFGIEYGPDISVTSFSHCVAGAVESFGPNWPDSGSHVASAYPDCISGAFPAVLAAFEIDVYGPAAFNLAPGISLPGAATLQNCGGLLEEIPPERLGFVGFCVPGFNPCQVPIPVEESTWGRIKKTFD